MTNAIQWHEGKILWAGSGTPKIGFHADCCCSTASTGCNACSDLAPHDFSVTVSDMDNGSCSKCVNFNGTFAVAFHGAWPPSNSNSCTWLYQYISGPCNAGENVVCGYLGSELMVSIYVSGGKYYVEVSFVYLSQSCASYIIHFAKEYVTKPDCNTFSDEDIPRVSMGDTICDNSNATCLITAL